MSEWLWTCCGKKISRMRRALARLVVVVAWGGAWGCGLSEEQARTYGLGCAPATLPVATRGVEIHHWVARGGPEVSRLADPRRAHSHACRVDFP